MLLQNADGQRRLRFEKNGEAFGQPLSLPATATESAHLVLHCGVLSQMYTYMQPANGGPGINGEVLEFSIVR